MKGIFNFLKPTTWKVIVSVILTLIAFILIFACLTVNTTNPPGIDERNQGKCSVLNLYSSLILILIVMGTFLNELLIVPEGAMFALTVGGLIILLLACHYIIVSVVFELINFAIKDKTKNKHKRRH